MTDKAEFLTDEGILSVADTCPLEGFDSEMIQFARAIEAAILRKLEEQERPNNAFAITLLSEACKSGHAGTIELAAQLAGVPACSVCGFVCNHCRCAAPVPKE